jgi:hypothetical protein
LNFIGVIYRERPGKQCYQSLETAGFEKSSNHWKKWVQKVPIIGTISMPFFQRLEKRWLTGAELACQP